MKLSDNNWFSINNTVIKKIDVELVGNSNNQLFFFKVRIPNISFNKSIKKNGYSIKKKYSNYDLYPYYKLYFKNNVYIKNNKEIYHYLKDSLREYKPCITFSNNKFNLKAKLLDITLSTLNSGNIVSVNQKYYLTYKVKFNKPIIKIPKTLLNTTITLKSKTLPKNRYEYGMCKIFNGNFTKCTDKQYFRSGGGSFSTFSPFGFYCQVFDMTKGPSRYKCSVIEDA